jgi:predicted ribosomally synthesized peptide with nif11-like leader
LDGAVGQQGLLQITTVADTLTVPEGFEKGHAGNRVLQPDQPKGLGHAGSPAAATAMSLDQARAFLARMQNEPDLKQQTLAAATADDVARLACKLGYQFSGDELLRLSGQRVGRVTVSKQDIPGEYH